jgi:nitroreductase
VNVFEAVKKRRTIRRFQQKPVPEDVLSKLIEAGRIAPSAANRQPLEFVVVRNTDLCEQVFGNVAWAGYVKPKRDPAPEYKPTAYIAVLINTNISPEGGGVDAAAAIENMLLVAVEEGLGACWMGAIQRDEIRKILGVPASHFLDSIVALGYPAEEPVMEEMTESHKYWLDDSDVLHVPKRKLNDILHWDKF